MDIYFIRHGEPDYVTPPNPLTKEGNRQAKLTAKFLSKIDFDYIFSSPLLRAKETAKYTAQKLHKDIIELDWASESLAFEDIGYRDDNNKLQNWIFFFPHLYKDVKRLKGNDEWYLDEIFKNHTYYKRGLERVTQEIHDWLLKYCKIEYKNHSFKKIGETPEKIALFAHGGFATLFLSTILNINYLDYIESYPVLDFCGVVHLRINLQKENIEVVSFNDVYYNQKLKYLDAKKLNNWQLFYVDDNQYDGKLSSIQKFEHFGDVRIPTLLEWELAKHRVEGDPYYSTYIWDYQKYESYHQFYVLKFPSTCKHRFIRFNGIDTVSEIYVNGKLIGKTDNMFISYTFELFDLQKENELIVHIIPSVLEGKKYEYDPKKVSAFKYNHESLNIRKSASSFGWDILPRTPLGGIYQDVEFFNKLPLIKDVHISSHNISKESATLKFDISLNEADIRAYDLEIEGWCGKDSYFFTRDNKIKLYQPKLWNIRHFGKPYLYNINIRIYKDKKLVATKKMKYGIRKVELFRSSTVEENGRFEFHINDQKVFLIGANWTPVDAINHVHEKRMLNALDLIDDLGCNVIRVWGGGTYELDRFYEECDKRGIFVWQDFMMACATYPRTKDFQKKLKEEVNYIVTKLRNHPSICLWSGDNECDMSPIYWSGEYKSNPNDNVLTRVLIPSLLQKLDDQRPFLPSSPYLDEYAASHLEIQTSEDHVWGPRDYFKSNFYRNSSCYFTSETGYHGLNNLRSLKTYLREPWPIFEGEIKLKEGTRLIETAYATKEYLAHAVSNEDSYDSPYAYRIKLMANQVRTLFVDDINNIEDFIFASQASQGEAMKYFIEKCRRDHKRNGGIIWWNILDGWAQPSEAVVDYYFSKKSAYYYIKNAQQKNLLFLDEENEKTNLYYSSLDDKAHTFNYQIIDAYNGDKVILEGTISTKPHSSMLIKDIKVPYRTFLIIKYVDENGKNYINHFHTHIIDLDLEKYRNIIEKYELYGSK